MQQMQSRRSVPIFGIQTPRLSVPSATSIAFVCLITPYRNGSVFVPAPVTVKSPRSTPRARVRQRVSWRGVPILRPLPIALAPVFRALTESWETRKMGA